MTQEPSSAARSVGRVAVLGAGTMGAQIAAYLADRGVPSDLLDLRSQGERPSILAEESKERLRSMRPQPFESASALDLVRTGNFDDDMERISQADWVLEAVVERLDVKLAVWKSAARHVRPGAIVSTNTSGIRIADIAKALPPEMRSRFLGTHFFNPPRYLPLLEIIPTPETSPEVLARIKSFATEVMGKGVVFAHDVPGFITNRVGSYAFQAAITAAEEFGLGFDEIDAITGPAMGRPNSATFRTLDLVGLDIYTDICDNLRELLEPQWERDAFEVPEYVRKMLERGWLGDKSGQGFYKRIRDAGRSEILVLDPVGFEYRPRRQQGSETSRAASDEEDVAARLRTLVSGGEVVNQVAWRILSQVLAYSAQKVGDVADDIISIDRAMRWGFNWSLGPFEMWDAIGLEPSVKRMQSDGLDVPMWVMSLAESGQCFYVTEGDATMQATPDSTRVPVPC
ncbi:MAG: hypothetical protein IIC21_06570 [Chloroflexi bacterium]|nr:hypothetical protein [Chloroflexota bacterium]